MSTFFIFQLPKGIRLICMLVFLPHLHVSIAQQYSLDSLWGIWNDTSQVDEERFKAMHTLNLRGYSYRDSDSSLLLGLELLTLAKEKNNVRWQSKAYSLIVTAYLIQGKMPQAREYIQQKLISNQAIGNQGGIAASHLAMGMSYQQEGNFDQALVYYEKSLEVNRQIDSERGMAACFNNLGTVYTQKGNYQKGLDYFYQTLSLWKKLALVDKQITTLTNIANIHIEIKDYRQAESFYDQATTLTQRSNNAKVLGELFINRGLLSELLDDHVSAVTYYLESICQFEQINHQLGLSRNYGNLGSLYLKTGEFELSEEYLLKAINISEEIGAHHELGIVYALLGQLMIELKRYAEGILWCEKGYDLLEFNDLGNLAKCVQCLSQIHEHLKHHETALVYQKQYYQLKDSLINESNIQQLTQIDMQYQHEKEKADILEKIERDRLIHEQKQRHRLIGFLIVVCALILFAISQLLYRSKLQQLNLQLEGKNDELEHFAYMCSHDLLSPLRSVKMAVTLVRRRLENEKNLHEDYQSLMAIILDGTDKLANTISSIRHLLQSDNEEQYPKENIVVDDLFATIESNLDLLIQEKGAHISFINSSGIDTFFNSLYALILLLQNLVQNGLKYNQASPPHIHVTLKKDNEDLIFEVKDNGVGIKPEFLEEIFQPFTSFSKNVNIKSSGLGLSICRKVITKMGGTIWAESTLGEGSTFFVRFPIQSSG